MAAGDAVMADLANHGGGTFAEYVSAPADAFERIPEGMSFVESSTLPHSPSWRCRDCDLQGPHTEGGGPGAGRGRIGQCGTVRGADREGHGRACDRRGQPIQGRLVREIGADEVLDYESVDYTRSGRRWDWILECDSHYLDPERAEGAEPRRHVSRWAARQARSSLP